MSDAIQVNDPSPGLGDVPGFLTAGTACDVRNTGKERLDLALVYSPTACTAAGVFTTNDVKAAPVLVDQEVLASGKPIHGFVVNSGNANACTGTQGMADAREMLTLSEQAAGAPSGSFFVCSTGRIGRVMPMANLRKGIANAGSALDSSTTQSDKAANAILTSDTKPKTVTTRFVWQSKTITVSGMGKGAGMIEPNMATMLAFIATNASVAQPLLQQVLIAANARSFNGITVDGDMSTNDTVLLLANGMSGIEVASENAELLSLFQEAVDIVCRKLAEKIVGDGERVTKFVRLFIKGAPTPTAAEKVARAIGNSLLVKTSWFGSDPNWGRLMDAAGYARIGLIEEKIDLFYNDVPALLQGMPQDANLAQWKSIVTQKEFSITLNLNLGEAGFDLLATDLSTGYVDFNKSE
ncbi:bifunctional glutamate N-acetyltransferase/amino-acid acetyltransferase ArgJ [Cerasicoccus arenae]|uniref:Arginine biosynthesis bifunctional protein ArgJ n=1 Tax=Cerasicoccus arenae TaxID=424488 RepID=A0A8J3DEF5_9BACT|nr:bifunctional glutamate N-acetyltransferase/amino-acid acetyltransferase ArgJ [Cerasicoccus arenae]MBK1856961.1 bifunctional glutamate N-acetyltransferase/amino-acid acetyltransferase ArgJ [Cerasicoccus arenae]GHB90073.1 arginine biosynthesis bifunctional protein ArgJ [Cerasicoccus arenae]